MVERYPHTAVIEWKGNPTQDNATGNWTAGTTITKTIKGRADINGSGSMVGLADGTQIVYNYIFVTSVQDFTAPYDAKITIGDIKGTVKRHVNNQTGGRIWL
jgi:Flp pilus assembly protein TadG